MYICVCMTVTVVAFSDCETILQFYTIINKLPHHSATPIAPRGELKLGIQLDALAIRSYLAAQSRPQNTMNSSRCESRWTSCERTCKLLKIDTTL